MIFIEEEQLQLIEADDHETPVWLVHLNSDASWLVDGMLEGNVISGSL